MNERRSEEIRKAVRDSYGRIPGRQGEGSSCCGPAPSSCCGPAAASPAPSRSRKLGYSEEEQGSVPPGADMGLGCGNPQAIAGLRPGETVLDLGCGGGFDCFLAARQVGTGGRVIGVDMTPQMIDQARVNARKGDFPQVEFRLGEIEHLPVADGSVDVVISNCVINLSPQQPQVYREAWRVLKPGGRLAVSDVVISAPLPEAIRNDPALRAGCVAGAATVEALERMLREAGFEEVHIQPKEAGRELVRDWAPGQGLERFVLSATIEGVKPAV